MRIKNWAKFQHFKDRRPPWIKLYRDILDDVEWHELDSEAAKVLVMLWVIASEDGGNLPKMKELAFRLRMSEKQTKSTVSKLSHWLEQDDIEAISDWHQDDAPETERETERETDKLSKPDGFDVFWKAYRRKEAKGRAEKALKAALKLTTIETILDGLKRFKWHDDKKYWPLAATWLNDRRWEDQADAPPASVDPVAVATGRIERIAWQIGKGIVNNLDATPAEITSLISAGRITEDQARKAGWAA